MHFVSGHFKVHIMSIESFIGLIISGIAITLSINVYFRDKKFSNENHLFDRKITAYQDLQSDIGELLHLIEELIIDLQVISKRNPADINEIIQQYDRQVEIVDNNIYRFEFQISKYLIIFPNSVLKKVDSVLNKMRFIHFPYSNIKVVKTQIDQLEKRVDALIEAVDLLNISIREDLNISGLNESLYKRIRTERKNGH